MTGPAASTLLSELAAALSEDRVSADPELLSQKAHDRSYHSWEPPLAVVQPLSTQEVSEVMRICQAYGIPVVPRGSGTGLEGGANTSSGSICLDLSGMKQIIHIAADDLYATAEAGVMKSELNAALAQYGLQFPAGPGVDASVGGMAATSASGTTAVRYGTLKENVVALTVVLADGSVIRTGSTTKKSSSGYDLTHLFVGSEGTLGVITEVTLALHPVPEASVSGVWSLPSLESAVALVVAALRSSLRLTRVELLDRLTVDALRRYTGYSAPVTETLMVEFSGSGAEVQAQYAQFAELAEQYRAAEHLTAADPEESRQLWQARHDVLPATLALVPGATAMATDVCVPISKLPECIAETKADLDSVDLLAPIVGHVGDGNFHLAMLLPPGDEQALARAKEINARLVDRALAMGGTCTGEHGVGIGKIGPMSTEHATALGAMRAVKSALDPAGLLNPGKVLG
ncbi:FAD-binding oxidoreductase [Nesterenkonia alkaliphila]|uniref:D-lactate dehydrogenase (cytochrome) n=1 Tax=Nesterenkonia alkaliphila TaxID=1463631 RepID=A0A7K1UKB2_9MICC|nr:FAD-linked oxidase C-terminal domain-containing protein [Nesterenkonia alkaliphila]MVT26762.1 FAD-binding protein [Nesterenkonia alkaliphila]GFZ77243.1 lactate dehydrogenase [Nesterenkonia alkaliphila]